MILKEDDHWKNAGRKRCCTGWRNEELMTLKKDDDWKQEYGMEGIQHGMKKRRTDDIKGR
jgi:hypothetical protein